MLISVTGLYKYFGEKLVLENINATVNAGDKIGLVGINGAGKSTLINLITGRLFADEGDIAKAKNLRIGILEQNSGLDTANSIEQEMKNAFSDALSAKKRADELALQMAEVEPSSTEYKTITEKYNREMAIFEAQDGYNMELHINRVLAGMGFAGRDLSVPTGTLSGGEKTRLAIAKLLLEAPDLLILDEPTNHLDFATLAWLEEYLSGFKGALLIVSHDRYFLDKLTNRIWDVEDHRLKAYKGNYSQFKLQKQMDTELALKEYEKQQTKIASMTDYAQRNIARASTSNSAKSRLHQLENMEVLEKPRTHMPSPSFSFEYDTPTVKDALTVNNLPIVAGEDNVLCESVSFEMKRGQRIALIGVNGCGKSTLLKTLVGEIYPKGGEIVWGKHTKIGYYEQEGRILDGEKTVLDEIRHRFKNLLEYEARGLLGRVLISGDNVYKQIKVLSGGEKAKVCFAVLMATRANTLVLDEPTNHIDLLTRESLEKALSQFDGNLIFVSHDRYFINAVADRIIEIDGGQIKQYEGNYDAYATQKSAQKLEQAVVKEEQRSKEENSYYRSKKQRAADVAKKKRISELERLIEECDEREKVLTEEMASPDVASDYALLAEKCAELEKLKTDRENYTEEWIILND
ncbi:MAG: ABC-F family ATP-binding cassette domain-containing protein [Clostridia bacterium]|nr:ABC-F family ATP-binding cassette domain-containing protein [Clostridia bacterium]